MSEKGIADRILSGWGAGLADRDAFVWVGTVIVLALASATLYAGWWRLAHRAPAPSAAEPEPTPPSGTTVRPATTTPRPPPAPPVRRTNSIEPGTQGWTTSLGTILQANPSGGGETRKLAAFTPLTVVEQSPNGDLLHVELGLVGGRRISGWIGTYAFQKNDPRAGFISDPGWVYVFGEHAVLRAMPHERADELGVIRQRTNLRRRGKIGSGTTTPGNPGYFYQVEATRSDGSHVLGWISSNDAGPSSGPPKSLQR